MTSDKKKGYDGYKKANKYIYNNHIKDSDDYKYYKSIVSDATNHIFNFNVSPCYKAIYTLFIKRSYLVGWLVK